MSSMAPPISDASVIAVSTGLFRPGATGSSFSFSASCWPGAHSAPWTRTNVVLERPRATSLAIKGASAEIDAISSMPARTPGLCSLTAPAERDHDRYTKDKHGPPHAGVIPPPRIVQSCPRLWPPDARQA